MIAELGIWGYFKFQIQHQSLNPQTSPILLSSTKNTSQFYTWEILCTFLVWNLLQVINLIKDHRTWGISFPHLQPGVCAMFCADTGSYWSQPAKEEDVWDRGTTFPYCAKDSSRKEEFPLWFSVSPIQDPFQLQNLKLGMYLEEEQQPPTKHRNVNRRLSSHCKVQWAKNSAICAELVFLLWPK